MSAWGDSGLLVELLDRQFKFLFDLKGTAQIRQLSRLLSFIQNEPQLVGILEDLRVEALAELKEYEAADAKIRAELARLWQPHQAEVRRRLSGVDLDALRAYWPMDRFEQGLRQTKSAAFSSNRDGVEHITEKLIRAFYYWWKCTNDLVDKGAKPLRGEYAKLGTRLERLLELQRYAARRLEENRRSLAWPAYERLVRKSTVTNPHPPDLSDDLAWMTFSLDAERATAVRRADVDRANYYDKARVDELYAEIAADARLLYEELRLRIGLARSRFGLVRRYAARCEAFEAQRLREVCEKQPRRAERILTLDLARYLFDAGLSPLIDATVANLRPDLLHIQPSSLFYVEAKQYAGRSPKRLLIKAYAQVWSTWGRLRKTYPTTEAFLVVFRRSGPWVELPPVIRHDGLRLYSVLADISTEAGSRQKSGQLVLKEEWLRPKESEE